MKDHVVMAFVNRCDYTVFLTKFGCLPLAFIDPPHHPSVGILTRFDKWDKKVWSLSLRMAKKFTKVEAREMARLLKQGRSERPRAVSLDQAKAFVVGAVFAEEDEPVIVGR